MLPSTLETPAALLLLAGGAIACFAGYRLFRLVLAVYGFVLGAMIASSTMGMTSTIGMVLAALLGGIAGALVLVFAYFVGIALVGAGLGALVAHMAWTRFEVGDPPALLVIGLAVVGAIFAMWLQRYVIILATAFGGAWTMILGVLAMTADRTMPRGDAPAVWILYPFAPATAGGWVPVAWIALGVIGTGVQLAVTARR